MQIIIVLLTGGIVWLIIPFTYYKRYVKRLVEQGYKPTDEKAIKYV